MLILDPTVAGVLITGLGALLAYLVASRAAEIARIQADVTLAQTRLAAEQTQLSAGAQASDLLGQFRSWASKAIDVLSEAAYECPKDLIGLPEARADCVRRCRYRLSALIDQGRLFLPNVDAPGVGANKPPAYRGLRHRVLDPLVAAERVLGGDADVSHFSDRRKALVHAKREFVSRVQAILQPRAQNEQLAVLLARSRDSSQDPTVGGLLPPPGSVPEGDAAVLSRPEHARDV
jgi:hypothetical protein